MTNYKNICKISDGEPVDLNVLSVQELYELHFKEESFIAQKILTLPPFSEERDQLTHSGYKFVTALMDVRDVKEFGKRTDIFGAGYGSANALVKLVRKKIRQNGRTPTVLCELGVGTGFAIQKISENVKSSELQIVGCDINLTPTARALTTQFSNVELHEKNAYEFLRNLPNESVDILYADNVFEHFCPDETAIIYAEIMKKLKPQAVLFLIIPNSHIGPNDISRRFLSMGEKATGFHFMEMTFAEITAAMQAHNVRQQYCVLYVPKIQKFILIKSRTLAAIKLKFERILAKIPSKFLKFLLFYCGGYHISVLKKY
ncbi:MAG: class I SAM-dependent methyltransferase [Turicibacter sp.]|nr:class I SAM-dependent methyltransferase [Turicibacter sp.]